MVAARADRRDVAQPARLREVGRARPCTTARAGSARRARRRSPPATPRRGPARAVGARRGNIRSTSRARRPRRPNSRPGRATVRRARRPSGARGRRRPTSRTRRRRATATRGAGSARSTAGDRAARATMRTPSGSTSARASQRTMPVGGTTHSSVSNGRSTSCGYHHESSCTDPTGRPRASRSSTAATTVEAASRPGSVRYQYALPLSVQYDTRVPSVSASRSGADTPDLARKRRAQRA